MVTPGSHAPPTMGALVIGASAGATSALGDLLPGLPADLPAPVFLVVHTPKDGPNLLLELFSPIAPLPLVEAEDKTPIVPGVIHVPPPDYHLLVESTDRLSLSLDAPVHFARPSIDVLFESAASVYGKRLVAVLLSGANEDGAAGLLAVRKSGGRTLVQDPRTAQMAVMPEAAIRLGAAEQILPVDRIAAFLAQASRDAHAARISP
jgi:two-component system chemotaxis response regulator CheB